MEKAISTWSRTLLGLATAKSVGLSMLFSVYAPTRRPVPGGTTAYTSTAGSPAFEPQSSCSRIASSATVSEASGTSSTHPTRKSSLSLSEMIEDAVEETSDAEVLEWERGLRTKYGIGAAMVRD